VFEPYHGDVFLFRCVFTLIVVMDRVLLLVEKQFTYRTSLQEPALEKALGRTMAGLAKVCNNFDSSAVGKQTSRIESGTILKCCCMANVYFMQL